MQGETCEFALSGRTTVFFYRRNPLEKAALSIWRPRYSPGFAFQGDARGSIQATREQERGQPCPRELDLKPETRGHGCPRSKRALPGGACVVAVLTVGRATEFFKDAKAPVFRFFVPFVAFCRLFPRASGPKDYNRSKQRKRRTGPGQEGEEDQSAMVQ